MNSSFSINNVFYLVCSCTDSGRESEPVSLQSAPPSFLSLVTSYSLFFHFTTALSLSLLTLLSIALSAIGAWVFMLLGSFFQLIFGGFGWINSLVGGWTSVVRSVQVLTCKRNSCECLSNRREEAN
ncbi:hypothetical protein L1049_003027 [Liquidambar formosana]|uniref:Uncharacterized protein n=1 Tax=Liquidambar formosana TaxID=63359 RepID=A0AAP0NIB9_LIQFO